MLLTHSKYQSSFDVAMYCAVECEHCAEACMGIPDMAKYARICLDCAEICRTSAIYMVRGSYFISHLTRAAGAICETCADECDKHEAEHCQKCAKACRQAAEVYRNIANVAAA